MSFALNSPNGNVPAFSEAVPLNFCTLRFTQPELESIRQMAVSFIMEKQQQQSSNINNYYNYGQLGPSSGNSYNLSFDPFHCSTNELYGVVLGMFLSCSMHSQLNCNWLQLLSFIADCHSQYRANPYHSFYHVVDVTFVVYYMLDSHGASRFLEQLDICVLLVSALCHDLMHPGMNNLFQINANTDVAHLYHQQSVLESLSVSIAESLLIKHGLVDDRFLRGLRSCILSTDMAHHFKLMQEFNEMITLLTNQSQRSHLNTGGEDESVTIHVPLESHKHRMTLMKILLHGADISNPCRPWELCKKWSDLVVTEFFQQGDLEKQLGLPVSPNMDRSQSNQIEISLGFGDVIVKPYFEMLASFVPEMQEFVGFHDYNRLKWIELNNFTVAHAPPPSATPSMSNLAAVLSSTKTPEQLTSNQSLEDSMRQLRTALIGRRVSVAAGVIQISEQMLSSLLNAKIAGSKSGRKISYEYVDATGSTANNTVANSKSPSTYHSIANLTNPQIAQLKQLQQQQQQSNIEGRKNVSKTSLRLADFGSTTSFIPSPPSSSNVTVTSRRASLSGGADDEVSPVRYNFARRRNSHTPALPPVESPARKKSYDSDSGVTDNLGVLMNSLSTEPSKIVDIAQSSTTTATSSEISPPSPIQYRVTNSISETDKIPPNRLFRPNYNLSKIAAALATTTVQRLLFANRIEQSNINRRLSAVSTKIPALGKTLPQEPLDGLYRTIHRSDRIHEQILSRRRARPTVTLHDLARMEELIQNHKLAPSSAEKKMPFIDPLLHAARTGEVQIIDNDCFDAFRRAFSEETIFQNTNHGDI